MRFAPLHGLLSDFKWTTETDSIFAGLKAIFAATPLLQYPDHNLPFIVSTNACDDGIGAV